MLVLALGAKEVVGLMVGAFVGMLEGIGVVGTLLGAYVGVDEGANDTVGELVGAYEGDPEGMALG